MVTIPLFYNSKLLVFCYYWQVQSYGLQIILAKCFFWRGRVETGRGAGAKTKFVFRYDKFLKHASLQNDDVHIEN